MIDTNTFNFDLETTMRSRPRSLQNRLKKILKASVPLTMTESEDALPVLTIDREEIEMECGGCEMKGEEGLSGDER
jgi:hypothetical protein